MIYPNGSEAVMSPGPWSQLIGVKHCPCEDGKARRVYRIGVPDTVYSAPGRVSVDGCTVSGFVTHSKDGYKFLAYSYGKNGHLIVNPQEATSDTNASS